MNVSNTDRWKRFLVISILGFFIIPSVGLSQSELPKFEVSAHYIFMHHSSFDQSNSGVGIRLGYNVTRQLAVESEFDFFPQKRSVLNSVDPGILKYYDSRRCEGLFGIKAGIRGRRIGVFGKVRPGFFYISQGKRYIDPDATFIRAPEEAQGQFRFAMDLGGIVEIYTSKDSYIRIDSGDTMVNFTRSQWGDISKEDRLSHNLQLSVGWGIRF